MHFNKTKVLLLGIFFSFQIIVAQNRQMNFEHLTTAQGLSDNDVFSICQDSIGFLWFGTKNGLNRYDGYNFKVFKYDRNNPNSISNNTIWAIKVCRDSTLWVATEDGLCRFDYEKEQFIRYRNEYKNKKSIGVNNIRSLYADSKHNLWIGTYGGGLYRMDDRRKGEFDPVTYNSDVPRDSNYKFISSIYEDKNQHLWIATDGGLYRLSDTNIYLRNEHIMSVFEDNDRNLWIGTWGKGLYQVEKWDPEKLQKRVITIHLKNDIIHDILEDSKGNLWIATQNGISIYSRINKKFSHYSNELNNPQSLSPNFIFDIFEDHSGIIWIATSGDGINKYNPNKKFELYQTNIAFNNIYTLYVEPDKNGDIVWIGSQTEGLYRWDRRDKNPEHYKLDTHNPFALQNGYIHAIYKDHAGRLWIGTDNGLSRYDQDGKIFYNYFPQPDNPNSLSSNEIYSLCEDYKHQLWIGTYKGGLNRINVDDIKNFTPEKAYFENPRNNKIFQEVNGIPILTIFEDRDSNIWIGTQTKGLKRYDGSINTFRPIFSDAKNLKSLSDNYVRCIYEDTKGTLWIGTANGLNKLLHFRKKDINPEFKIYTKKDGLSNISIHGILEDEKGYLWISTDKGISKMDTQTGKFTNYGSQDGLQSGGFNDNVCRKGYSGKLYFGGKNGLNVICPNIINEIPKVIPIFFIDFKISDQSVSVGTLYNGRSILSKSITLTKNIELTEKDKIFSIEFAALQYSSTENIEYTYKLEGYDTAWIKTISNTATYTSLDPGNYTFKVKTSYDENNSSDKIATIKITITEPIWNKGWFKTALIILLLVLVLIIYNYWVHRIATQTKLLEEKVKERTAKKNLEENVAKRTHELQLLNEAFIQISDLLPKNDLKVVLKGIANNARALFLADLVCLYRYDDLKKKIISEPTYSGNFYNGRTIEYNKNLENLNFDITNIINNTPSILIIDSEVNYNLFINQISRVWQNNIFDTDFWHREEIKLCICVKLEHNERFLGVIFLNFRNYVEVDDRIKKLVFAYASITTSILINAEYLGQLSKMTREAGISFLASGIAHEFNNYLQSFITNIGLIKLKSIKSIIKPLNDLENGINMANRVIENFKQIKDQKNEVVTFDTNQLIRELLALSNERFKIHRIEVVYKNNLKNTSITMNQADFQTLIVNLLSNASESIIENKQKGNIYLTLDENENDYIIKLEDSGTGIDEREKLLIFSPFYSSRKMTKGMGLGLFWIQQIITQNDGDIEVNGKNWLGGATFNITLPKK